jgi:hypothetical protein
MKIEFSDEDLKARVRNFEDPFVERKSSGDVKDILKSAVAFANSLPIDAPGVIFVPAKDDGSIERNQNLDKLQKTITEKLNAAYPQLPTLLKIFGDEDGAQALALIVWGSRERPHFSGPAYVRKGSQTFEASEDQFRSLIAQRNSKVAEVEKWKGQLVRVRILTKRSSIPLVEDFHASVVHCNQFWIILQRDNNSHYYSAPLSRVELSFDAYTKQLEVEIWQQS